MNEQLTYGVKSLDDFAPIYRKQVVGLFGEPNVGKSMLSGQLAVTCNLPEDKGGFNAPSLIIDTEGFWLPHTTQQILKMYQERFDIRPKVDIYRARGESDLYALFNLIPDVLVQGKKTEAYVYKKPTDIYQGRKKVGQIESLEGSPIYQMISNKGYGLIIVDSVSSVVKALIAMSKSQNRTARTDLQAPLYTAFQSLAETFNIPIIVVNHVSVNPENRSRQVLWGGAIVSYNLKVQLLITVPDYKYPSVRKIIRVRYPAKAGIDAVLVNLQENFGYTELTTTKGSA